MTDETGSNARVEFSSQPDVPVVAIGSRADMIVGATLGLMLGALAIAMSVALSPGNTPFPEYFGVAPFMLPFLYLLGGAFVGGAAGRKLGLFGRQHSKRAQRENEEAVSAAKADIQSRPLSTIANTDGSKRIRGTVRVIDAPAGEPDDVAISLVNGRKYGRFAIVDDSGEALVDDDMLEFFAGAHEDVLRDGDWVEATGPGAPGVVPGAQGSYRGQALGFRFDGSPDEKVHLLKIEAPPPRARVQIDEPDELEVLSADENAARRGR